MKKVLIKIGLTAMLVGGIFSVTHEKTSASELEFTPVNYDSTVLPMSDPGGGGRPGWTDK